MSAEPLLPPLPTPWKTVADADGLPVDVFRAFQVRDYARSAQAAAQGMTEAGQLEQACHEATFARELLTWAYTKLHYRSFSDLEDALQLDRIKLYLEHGIAS